MRPMPMEDPRDNLEKATRWELYEFAKQHGCTEIQEGMPALLAVQILRAKGLTNIRVEAPPLGSIAVLGQAPYSPADKTVDALADLKRQYAEQQTAEKAPDPHWDSIPQTPVDQMKFNEIRAELKRRGVKLSRKDTLEVLRAKLNGENAA